MSDGNTLTKGRKKEEETSNGKKVLDGFIALSIMSFNGMIWLGEKFLDLAVWVSKKVGKRLK